MSTNPGDWAFTCKTMAPSPAIKTTKSMGLYPNKEPAWRSTLQFPLYMAFHSGEYDVVLRAQHDG